MDNQRLGIGSTTIRSLGGASFRRSSAQMNFNKMESQQPPKCKFLDEKCLKVFAGFVDSVAEDANYVLCTEVCNQLIQFGFLYA